VRTRATIVKKEKEPIKEEPVDDAVDDDEELPELEEILRSAGKRCSGGDDDVAATTAMWRGNSEVYMPRIAPHSCRLPI
jgi:hypothetical protein